MEKLENIVNFLYEVGMLSKTPRSGFYLVGSGSQSVAEHLNRTTFIGYVLCTQIPEADSNKVIKMCLFHDLAEARTSDLNYVHQKYAKADEGKVLEDIAETLPFGPEIKNLVSERNSRETLEAKIAKDADNLEWILSMKEQADTGNTRAAILIISAKKRLYSEEAKKIAEQITNTPSDNWWFSDKDDTWWVNKN